MVFQGFKANDEDMRVINDEELRKEYGSKSQIIKAGLKELARAKAARRQESQQIQTQQQPQQKPISIGRIRR